MSLVTTVSVPPTHAVPSVPRIDGLPVAGALPAAKVNLRSSWCPSLPAFRSVSALSAPSR